MILRPPSGPFDPWSMGNTRFGESFIWIAAAVALVFGVILLISYFNTKRISHILWSISFVGIYVYFHIMIASGDLQMFLTHPPMFMGMFEAIVATLLWLIPGLLAAGLYYEVFEDKRIGNFYTLFVVIMVFLAIVFKIDPSYGANTVDGVDIMPGLGELCALIVTSASYASIIALPLIKAEGTKLSLKVTLPELVMSLAGIIASVFGILLSMIAWADFADPAEDAIIDTTMQMFSFFLLGAVILGLYGIITSKRWEVQIPGIEFETRAPAAA